MCHHTQGIESMSLLLLPSAANCLLFNGEVFPLTLCFVSPSSPLTWTRLPLDSANSPTSTCPLLRGIGVCPPDPLLLRRERDLTLAWRDWVGVASRLFSPLPRLLGVGVLLELEVTGVDTVLRLEMVDCWEFLDGDL